MLRDTLLFCGLFTLIVPYNLCYCFFLILYRSVTIVVFYNQTPPGLMIDNIIATCHTDIFSVNFPCFYSYLSTSPNFFVELSMGRKVDRHKQLLYIHFTTLVDGLVNAIFIYIFILLFLTIFWYRTLTRP